MTGAGGVVALVLLEWSIGSVGAAAWTQSWSVVTRGHFRIVAWSGALLGVLAVVANRAATEPIGDELQRSLVGAVAIAAALYVVVQYSRTDVPGTIVGAATLAAGVTALVVTAGLIPEWPQALAAAQLVAGTALLGAVTNGMLLGHWYLNQPGLKPWALARLTDLSLGAAVASAVFGIAGIGRLAGAETEGALLGLPGFGGSFSPFFYVAWLALVAFTAAVVWAARRCVKIRSIQSATGLFYVAILTAGTSEFVVRYLMVHG